MVLINSKSKTAKRQTLDSTKLKKFTVFLVEIISAHPTENHLRLFKDFSEGEGGEMRSSKGTSGLREARGEGTSGLREARGESVSGTEREARGGERREGDVFGLGKRLLGCREQR
ncbi:hypothetical protein OIU76_027327 [Salix suchowensis]|nr:hypothetical protein OIU76_027327 [Salix suchowensis]